MNSNTSWIVGIVIVIAVLAGAWYIWGSGAAPAPAPATTQAIGSPAPSTSAGTPAEQGIGTPAGAPVRISYTDNGFSPASITVKKGQPVTFTNNSADEMWVASNPHPTHQGYDGTTKAQHCTAGYSGPAPFDECVAVNAGGSYTFTFTKTGTWGYHNHGNASDAGTVVVTQ